MMILAGLMYNLPNRKINVIVFWTRLPKAPEEDNSHLTIPKIMATSSSNETLKGKWLQLDFFGFILHVICNFRLSIREGKDFDSTGFIVFELRLNWILLSKKLEAAEVNLHFRYISVISRSDQLCNFGWESKEIKSKSWPVYV